MSGTIGAVGNNGIGVAGVCWEVSIIGVKFLAASGSGTIANGIEAVSYTTTLGVDLTSNSWGGSGFSQALKNAIEEANEKGMLFVASAGNSNRNTDSRPAYPASYDNANIISVLASDHNDGKASFSNYGKVTVDLGAPGVNTLSTGLRHGYRTASGTSMACPHVSGAYALIRAVTAPVVTHLDIKEAILETVDPIGHLAERTLTGGRLNVHKAIQHLKIPHVVVDAFEVDEVVGNQDGVLNPGESVNLSMRFVNVSIAVVSNLQVQLVVDDPLITVSPETVAYTLVEGEANAYTAAVPFGVTIASETPTPRPLDMVLRLSGDGEEGPYVGTNHVERVVYTSSIISGRVVRASSDLPVEGAEVRYAGTRSGLVTTDAEGLYAFLAVDGTYDLVASKAGLVENNPATIEVPPSAYAELKIGLPEIALPSATFEVALHKAAATTMTFRIANTGDIPLNVSLRDENYVADDSDQSGGPAYVWNDISATGMLITNFQGRSLRDNDYYIIPVNIPIRMYDLSRNWIFLNANGFLSLLPTEFEWGKENNNTRLPSENVLNNLVAFFWDDLDFTTGGRAHYQQLGNDRLAIQFSEAPFSANKNKRVTCQVVMREEGEITCYYKRVDIPDSCTVGVQNTARDEGLNVVFNEPYLHNEMAVRMRPLGAPWLTPLAQALTIDPGASSDIPFSFENLGRISVSNQFGLSSTIERPMRVGIYTALVALVSSDLDDPQTIVPVVFRVEGNPENQPPSSRDIHITLQEDTPTNIDFTALGSGVDPDGDELYYDIVTRPATGQLFITSTNVQYRPASNFFGEDQFTFVADDLEAYSATSTVFVTVEAINDAPASRIVSPANRSYFDVGEAVPVRIFVRDVDSEVTSVEVWSDGIMVAEAMDVSNEFYEASFTPAGEGSNQVTVVAYDREGLSSTSAPISVLIAPLIKSDGPGDTLPGLEYAYYEGEWDALPDFDALVPAETGIVSRVTLEPKKRDDRFALTYRGYFRVQQRGVYTFHLTSDEGSRLIINGQEVIDNDGLHEAKEVSGSIGLDAGHHSFSVAYFERTGEEKLELLYSPPNVTAKWPVHAHLLSRFVRLSEHRLVLEHGIVRGVGDAWQTVALSNTYRSMVVVCTPSYERTHAPAVVRIRHAQTNHFELRALNPGGGVLSTPIGVHYLVVEEGTYGAVTHGIGMEAVKFTSSITDHSGQWRGQAWMPTLWFSSPVVVGQVMSYNDVRWSAFWSRGKAATDPVRNGYIYVGKHVGADPATARTNETLGFVVMNAGSGTFEDLSYWGGVGPDGVQGMDDKPPYSYGLFGKADLRTGVASQTGMDGGDGSWAVLYGEQSVSRTNLLLAVDEDQIVDEERAHTTEQVAYLLWGGGSTGQSNAAPVAVADAAHTPRDEPVTIDVLANDHDPNAADTLAVVSVSRPDHGAAVIETNQTISYTPHAGFVGADQFSYTIQDPHGARASATVDVEVLALPPQILGHPQDLIATQGQEAVFMVEAIGDSPLAYQWRRNGEPIVGAIATSHVVVAQQSDHGSRFDVLVSNPGGLVTSRTARLRIDGEPEFLFRASELVGYGGSQDSDADAFEVLDNGRTLHLFGNNWKAVPFPYPYVLTSNTVLALKFRSDGQPGEINAVGLDEDLQLSNEKLVQLSGTQTWGIQNIRDFPRDGEWRPYRIPIGKLCQGGMHYLVFANDADNGQATDIRYSEVQVYEDPSAPAIGEPVIGAAPPVAGSVQPSPDLNSLIRIRYAVGEGYRYTVEYTEDLKKGGWLRFDDGVHENGEVEDRIPKGVLRRYYRIGVEP